MLGNAVLPTERRRTHAARPPTLDQTSSLVLATPNLPARLSLALAHAEATLGLGTSPVHVPSTGRLRGREKTPDEKLFETRAAALTNTSYTDVPLTSITIDWGNHAGHLCLQAPNGVETCAPTLPPVAPNPWPSPTISLIAGTYYLYTYASYNAAGVWAPVMVSMTYADGKLTIPSNPHVELNGSTLLIRTRPLTVKAENYHTAFTFDWSQIWSFPRAAPATTPFELTTTLLVGRSYTLMDMGSGGTATPGSYAVGAAGDIFINDDATAEDIRAGTKNSFEWTPGNRTLTAKLKQVTLDMDGYRGYVGFGTRYFHGPNPGIFSLLMNRYYGAFDYGSGAIANNSYYFSTTQDINVAANGTVTVAQPSSNFFEALPNDTIRLRTGTMQVASWDGYIYFPGFDLGIGGGTGTNGPTAKLILGRKYYASPHNVYFDFSAAGVCSQTSFPATSYGGNVTIACAPPAPPIQPFSDPRMACVDKPEGFACDDGNPCTTGGTCDGNGTCTSETRTCQDVVPQVTCKITDTLPAQGFTVVFGYLNNSRANVPIDVGPQNYVDTPSTDRGQPRIFDPGTVPAAFTVHSTGPEVEWHVGTQTANSSSATECNPNAPAGTPRLVQTADGPALEVTSAEEGTKLFLLFPDPTAIATGRIVATTPGGLEPLRGDLDVSSDGSATYNVPLWVPPGRNGMQPDVSLNYSSRGGNGVVGVGWSLSAGLSRITRCNRNPINSGTLGSFRAVRFDAQDLLCLDGNPLVLVSGTYGAAGEYRTRKTIFAKITSATDGQSGQAAMGPATFEVRHKNGRIHTYKRAQDLGITAFRDGQAANYAWLVTKIEDRFKNNIVFTYDASTFSGESNDKLDIRIKSIRYTGHNASVGDREVEFSYSPNRPDLVERYNGGVAIAEPRRLTTITMKGPAPSAVGVLRSYSIVYGDQDPLHGATITGRSIITKIRECDPDNVCRPWTSFTWEKGSDDFALGLATQVQAFGQNLPYQQGFSVADVDMDGRDDLIFVKKTTVPVGTGPGSSFKTLADIAWAGRNPQLHPSTFFSVSGFARTGLQVPGDAYVDPVVIDLNNDHRADIGVFYKPGGVTWQNMDYGFRDGVAPASDPPQTENPPNAANDLADSPIPDDPVPAGTEAESKMILSADITGDGAPEIFRKSHAGNWWVRKGTHRDGVLVPYTMFIPKSVLDGPVSFDPMDIDGDGVMEVIVNQHWIARAHEFREEGNVLEDLPGIFAGPADILAFWDVNGDGLNDVMSQAGAEACTASGPAPAHAYCVWINRGGTFRRDHATESRISATVLSRFFGPSGTKRNMDFDGDGVVDVVDLTGSEQGHLDVVNTLSARPARPKAGGAAFPVSYLWQPLNQPSSYRGSRFIDVNDDGLQDVLQLEGPAEGQLALKMYKRLGKKPDVIKNVENGIGATTSIDYRDISDLVIGGAGKPGYEGCGLEVDSPQRCVKRGVSVVWNIRKDNPTQALRLFGYKEAVRDTRIGGSGLLFRHHSRTRPDLVTGEDTEYYLGSRDDDFAADAGFLQAGKPKRIVATRDSSVEGPKFKSETSFAYHLKQYAYPSGAKAYAVLPAMTLTQSRDRSTDDYDDDGVEDYDTATTKLTDYHPDEYGNLASEKVTTIGVFSQPAQNPLQRSEVTTIYRNDAEAWLIGFPEDVKTRVYASPSAAFVDRHKTAVPWPGKLRAQTETIMPNGGQDVQLTTTYVISDFGMTEKVTTTGWSGSESQSRITETVYDPIDHAFPIKTTNAANHPTEMVFHRGYGLLLWSKDANDAASSISYDRFGRVRVTKAADGSGSQTNYEPGTGPAALAVRVIQDGGGESLTSYDIALREVSSSVKNSAGRWTTTKRDYDYYWRVFRIYTPIEEAQPGSGAIPAPPEAPRPSGSTTFSYDARGRLIYTVYPDGLGSSVHYRPYLTTFTDRKGNQTYEVLDVLGRVWETGLGDGIFGSGRRDKRLTLTYDSENHVETVTDTRLNVTRYAYDGFGRRKESTDPNSGKRTTRYNAFGEVWREEVEGEATPTTLVRDKLGRISQRSDKDGTTTFRWDSQANGRGSLGDSRSSSGVTNLFTYDDIGRASAESVYVGGEWFTTSRGYDPDTGRLDTVVYPNAPQGTQNAITTAVKYEYDALGAFKRVKASDSALSYLEVKERDILGRVTKEVAGDLSFTQRKYGWLRGTIDEIAVRSTEGGSPLFLESYDYDENLSLKSRVEQSIPGASDAETFEYDEQDRLKVWRGPTALGSSSLRWKVAYDPDVLGNLQSRTLYPGETGAALQTISYASPTTQASRPHGVQSTTLAPSSPPSGTSFAGAFVYDPPRGYQKNRPDGETVDYTAFELPTSVTRAVGSQFRPNLSSSLMYDAGGTRVMKSERLGAADEASTKYVGGLYEKRRGADGVITHVFYVSVGGRQVAQITRAASTPTVATVDYLHRDRLGSVTTVTAAAAGGGAQLRGRTAYDPYGNQYDRSGTPYLTTVTTEVASGVRLGFTGHEMDNDLGLVNMRGRMYDAKVGRFLSPDPVLVSQTWDQAYNRYAYAANNPLKYTDPTGYNIDVEGCGTTTVVKDGVEVSVPVPCPHAADAQAGADLAQMVVEDRDQYAREEAEKQPAGNNKDGQSVPQAAAAQGGNETPPKHEVTTYQQLTDAEKAFVRHHPLIAKDFHKAMRDAVAETGRRYPGTRPDDRGDAFRHAYWNALMTSKHGRGLAKEFADAHENYPNNPARQRDMDLHNNAVGRNIGANPERGRSLADQVDQALSERRLIWYRREEIWGDW